MRMYVVFEKGERLRHIGHLDIMRTMQRAYRRSGLPVSYSKGFNPHILLGFASALSVGAVGRHELMEITLDQDVEKQFFVSALEAALPEDIAVRKCGVLPENGESLMAMVRAAAWEGWFPGAQAGFLAAGLQAMMQQEEILGVRKGKAGPKEVNIRPLILAYHPAAEGFSVVLSQEEGNTCKPSMLLEALGKHMALESTPRAMLTRTHLMTRTSGGELVPLEDVL